MRRKWRRSPYKNFRFAVTFVAISAVAIGIARKLLRKAELKPPGVYVEEIPTSVRPIEGVATSTAGRRLRGRDVT